MSESEAMIERYWIYSLTRLFACFLRWKKVFDKLEIGGDEGGKKKMTTLVLEIMNSEDMKKLRALAELSSREFFCDNSLRVAVCRRILEVLVLGEGFGDKMKAVKQRGGKKKGKKSKAAAAAAEEAAKVDVGALLGLAPSTVGGESATGDAPAASTTEVPSSTSEKASDPFAALNAKGSGLFGSGGWD